MDWRSSSNPGARWRGLKRPLVALCLSMGLLIGFALTSGCGKSAVRAGEKEFLADRIMIFDSDGQEAGADQHILTNREGSAGGSGTGGGGCGCN